jgi:hypothetical protein
MHFSLKIILSTADDDYDDYAGDFEIADRFVLDSPPEFLQSGIVAAPRPPKVESDFKKIDEKASTVRKVFPESWIFDSITNDSDR